VIYTDNVSYLFEKSGLGVCSISFPKDSQVLIKFEDIINQFTEIVDYGDGNVGD
jgi:uncharacterized protein YkuJ